MKQLKIAIKKFLLPPGNLFRYSLSFCLVLALLPSLIILIQVFEHDLLDAKKMIDLLYDYIPEVLLAPFFEYILARKIKMSFSVIISTIFSLFIASNAIYSLMLIVKEDEHFESYNILIRIKAVVLFVILVITIMALAIINYWFSFNPTMTMVVGLFLVFYYFYRFLSFFKRPLSYGILGAVFTSIAIVVIGMFFFYIVERYTRYYVLYGPLASLVIMLFSIYLIASVIYFGYCLNYAFNQNSRVKKYKHERYFNFGNHLIDQIIKKILVLKDDK